MKKNKNNILLVILLIIILGLVIYILIEKQIIEIPGMTQENRTEEKQETPKL